MSYGRRWSSPPAAATAMEETIAGGSFRAKMRGYSCCSLLKMRECESKGERPLVAALSLK